MKKKDIRKLIDEATHCAACKAKFGLLAVKVLHQKTKKVFCEGCG